MVQRLASLSLVATSLLVAGNSLAQAPSKEAAHIIPVPHASNFAAWNKHITPDDAELRWEQIPWRPTFGEGLAAAGRAKKLLLFWGMNGHPLGCT